MCREVNLIESDSEEEEEEEEEEFFTEAERRGYDIMIIICEETNPRLIGQLVRKGSFAYGPVQFSNFFSVTWIVKF